MKTIIMTLSLFLAILLTSSGTVQAYSIATGGDYSDSYSSLLPWDPSPHMLTVDKFDPTLGTLRAIQFDLSAHSNGTIDMTNLTNGNSSYTANLGANVSVNTPTGGLLVLYASPIASSSGTLSANQHLVVPGLIDSQPDSSTFLESNLNTLNNMTTAQWNDFIGSGTVNLPSFGIASYSFTGPNISNAGMAFVTELFNITYFYDSNTTVPEPGTMFTVAVGISGLAFLRRRQKNRQLTI